MDKQTTKLFMTLENLKQLISAIICLHLMFFRSEVDSLNYFHLFFAQNLTAAFKCKVFSFLYSSL
ncbi:hypothetical protein BpHYR1_031618 [Brachionus plicatilis]|uniref:Uncharacterized protein n=1 Tax=Brachionus plicatilis TaxID=10195 RepID=A0A3M7SIL2_BRAPC|nr:hypothetical protein BpHYR1_031618 [Brachionus plicatilis]